MFDKAVLDAIRKHAVKNALDYGKANEKTVLGRILSEFPETKKQISDLNRQINEIVSSVNSLSKEQIQAESVLHADEFAKAEAIKAKESVPKFILDGAVEGKFFARFSPEPNGYPHIGHAKIAFMEREFTDIYRGNLALYFDDTNPEAEKQEYVDAIRSDLSWLGIKFDREYYSSDHIPQVYANAEKLISQGDAYACSCPAETMSENREKGIECAHRSSAVNVNLDLWKKMINKEFGENQIAIRLKGDMKSLNTVMRDPVLLRIKVHPHYRQGTKYAVWPTYDFNTPIVDSIEGITDAMRSKEYELRDELYAKILDLLGLRKPRIHSIARLEIKDGLTSKRKVKELIEQGLLMGYDDPRLVTVASLRRRGIVPEAIKKFVLRFGMSKTNSEVDISMLLDENRKIIDKSSKRLFFVQNPRKITIEGAPMQDVKIRLLDGSAEFREYKAANVVYISDKDAKLLKAGDKIRFKDLFIVEIVNSQGDTCKFIGGDQKTDRTVQWVSEGNYIDAKLLIPGRLLVDGEFNKESLEHVSGFIESYASKLNQGEIVQLERVGFFRLDSKQDMTFIGS
ncbi:MAG: glutamate--tRNA ligase [Candidatus Micrarchaeota archaeon]|nr:glutamate--tRNA ligase [Candidatus Micrarchaeota archaeon]